MQSALLVATVQVLLCAGLIVMFRRSAPIDRFRPELIVTWLVVVAVYGGGSSLTLTLFGVPTSGPAPVRALGHWHFVVLLHMVAVAAGFAFTVANARPRERSRDDSLPLSDLTSVLFVVWAVCGLATVVGAGFRSAGEQTLLVQLSSEFLVLTTGLLLGLVMADRPSVPLLRAAVILGPLLVAGQRRQIVVALVVGLLVVGWLGAAPSRASLVRMAVPALLVLVVISASRLDQHSGTIEQAQGVGDVAARVSSTARGVTHLTDPGSWAEIGRGAAARVDGNIVGASLVENDLPGIVDGYKPLSNSLLYAVPSSLHGGKLDTDVWERTDATIMMRRSGLPLNIDYLTPAVAGQYAMYGLVSVLILGVVSGVLLGLLSSALWGEMTAVRLIVGAGAISTVLAYEGGMAAMFATARTVVLMVLVVAAVQAFRSDIPRAALGGRAATHSRL